MTILINQYILGLQIPINDLILMQMFQSQHYLGTIKHSTNLCKLTGLSQMKEQLSPLHEIHNHIKFTLTLKCAIELHYIRMILHILQYLSFGLSVQDLVFILYHVFFQHFHRIQFFIAGFFDQVDFTKRAFAEKVKGLEILQI